ncbi:hypothetical protein Tco_1354688 [Tanacetum coccineum]
MLRGQVPVNADKQSSPRAATSISTTQDPGNSAASQTKGNPQYTLHDQRVFDSGCSRHMTGNKSFLTDYQEIDRGFVAFGGCPKGGTNANIDEGQGGMKTVLGPQYVLLPFLTSDSQSPKSSEDEVADDAGKKNRVLDPAKEDDKSGQEEATNTNSSITSESKLDELDDPCEFWL